MTEESNVVEFPTPLRNDAGIWPVEFKVLIEPLAVQEKIGSVWMPDSAKDKEKFAQVKGRIIACSPHAFSYVDDEAWVDVVGEKPHAGDLVLYAKYAGVWVKGKDGKDYLLINDKDVCATIEE
jgi:co-chaperonin GroES (HSP10)